VFLPSWGSDDVMTTIITNDDVDGIGMPCRAVQAGHQQIDELIKGVFSSPFFFPKEF
jgi:hypothetical protein